MITEDRGLKNRLPFSSFLDPQYGDRILGKHFYKEVNYTIVHSEANMDFKACRGTVSSFLSPVEDKHSYDVYSF